MSKVAAILYHAKMGIFVIVYSLVSLVFISSILYSSEKLESIKGKVYFLDVGQGDSVLIIFSNGNRMLIDAGNVDGKAVDEIRKILPWYDRRIDIALGTHADIDHVGGFTKVVQNFTVGLFLFSHLHTSKPVETFLFDSIDRVHVATSTIDRGAMISSGIKNDISSDHVNILYPPRMMRMTSDKDTNLFSIVAMAYIRNKKYLLTGDAPRSVELELVFASTSASNLFSDLHAYVLKAGHHGSRTSTDPIFVQSISPTYAIISAGKNNRYGHPHVETLETFEKENIKILKTYDSGTIAF
ncbi:MAG: MBL fold metallo-hydrolase [bacterium]